MGEAVARESMTFIGVMPLFVAIGFHLAGRPAAKAPAADPKAPVPGHAPAAGLDSRLTYELTRRIQAKMKERAMSSPLEKALAASGKRRRRRSESAPASLPPRLPSPPPPPPTRVHRLPFETPDEAAVRLLARHWAGSIALAYLPSGLLHAVLGDLVYARDVALGHASARLPHLAGPQPSARPDDAAKLVRFIVTPLLLLPRRLQFACTPSRPCGP